jgi:hypothetical protein
MEEDKGDLGSWSRGGDAEVMMEVEFEAAIRAYKFELRFLIFTSPSIHDTSARPEKPL